MHIQHIVSIFSFTTKVTKYNEIPTTNKMCMYKNNTYEIAKPTICITTKPNSKHKNISSYVTVTFLIYF